MAVRDGSEHPPFVEHSSNLHTPGTTCHSDPASKDMVITAIGKDPALVDLSTAHGAWLQNAPATWVGSQTPCPYFTWVGSHVRTLQRAWFVVFCFEAGNV